MAKEKTKADLQAEVSELKAAAEKNKATIEKLTAKKAKVLETRRDDAANDMRAKLEKEEHQWVSVFHKALKDGTDFSFDYEGLHYKLASGSPIKLSVSVIKHLKNCHFPQAKYDQGEAGQAVKTEGQYHRFAVVNCEEPEKAIA